MASGIRSVTRLAPRVPVQDTIPEAWPTQASRLATPEVPMAVGIPLARQEALRNEEEEAGPTSADPSARRPASVGAAMVGEALGGVTIGTAGGVGASASAGRTGVFIGDRPRRLRGILGG